MGKDKNDNVKENNDSTASAKDTDKAADNSAAKSDSAKETGYPNAKKTRKYRRSLSNAEIISNNMIQNLIKKSRRKKARQMFFFIFIAIVMCVIFTIACSALFFNVKEIRVNGSVSQSDDAIIEASGIIYGKSIYAFSEKEISDRIVHSFPYVASVKLKRLLPVTVNLNLSEEKPLYYVKLFDEYFVLSRELRILERTNNTERIKSLGVDEIITYPIKQAVVGEKIVFKNRQIFEFTRNFLLEIELSELADGVSYIDLSNKFNVFLICDERFKIFIGSDSQLSSKLIFANSILTQYFATVPGIYEINVEENPGYALPMSVLTY